MWCCFPSPLVHTRSCGAFANILCVIERETCRGCACLWDVITVRVGSRWCRSGGGEASIFMNIARGVIGDAHQPHLNHMGRAWLVPARVLAVSHNVDLWVRSCSWCRISNGCPDEQNRKASAMIKWRDKHHSALLDSITGPLFISKEW